MRSGVTLALALSGTLTLAVASTIAQADDPAPTVASAKHDLDDADTAYANVDFEGASKFARLQAASVPTLAPSLPSESDELEAMMAAELARLQAEAVPLLPRRRGFLSRLLRLG